MAVRLDTAERTQVNASPLSPHSIYDVSKKEVFARSFLAGLSLGLGSAVASFLFFAFVLGALLTILQPVLNTYFPQLNQLDLIFQQLEAENAAQASPTPSPLDTSTTTRTTN